MSEFIAGNSIIKGQIDPLYSAVNTATLLDAINSNGKENNSTTQAVGHHADGTAQRLGIAELDAIGKVESEVCDTSRDILKSVHNADQHVSDSVERHGLHNADVTERENHRTQAGVERFGLSNRDALEREARHIDAAIERQAYRTQEGVEKFGLRELDAIRDESRYLYAGMSQNAKEMLLEFERTKLQMKNDFRDVFVEIKDGNKDLLLQACGNAKDAALAARDLMHQADKNTAAVQLEAFRHKEELARQIAECCCEQKELTREKANETQQLLRELDKERIRDELAKTREELIALRVRSTLTPPLVGSVPL